MTTQTWQITAQQKRESILALIPAEWRLDSIPSVEDQVDVTAYIEEFLNQEEQEITQASANVIADKVASGTWSAETVTRAFCHRAALAHQLLSCLHEIFFDAAIEDAKKLDAFFRENRKTKGPLHGVPVSLKDQFHVKGVETSMGYVGWIGTFEGKKGTGKEKVYESEMVKMLRDAGAVLYCKTSVPHTLMAGETVNNIIEWTYNPKNRNLTSGGSSGGEGALIGIRGSPLGFGTDIGGSIRIPSSFNGLWGLRPSTGRLPYEGMANSMDGQNSILSVVGPMATNAASLRLATETLLSQKPWLKDPMVHEIPWRADYEHDLLSKLRSGAKLSFGVLATDGTVNPTPPVERAISILTETLRSAGHEVLEWKPPSHATLLATAGKTWVFDGGADVRSAFELSGEPMAPQIALFKDLEREFTGSEIAATNVELRTMRKEYMEYWNSTESQTNTGRAVDAVICPLAPWPAARRNSYKYYGYSLFVNMLDYTSVAVPVTNVDKSVDKKVEGYQALNELDGECQELYDPEIYDGAHVGVQIVGRRLQEEKMLAIAEYVEELLQKKSVP